MSSTFAPSCSTIAAMRPLENEIANFTAAADALATAETARQAKESALSVANEEAVDAVATAARAVVAFNGAIDTLVDAANAERLTVVGEVK